MREVAARFLFLVLIVEIPFELRQTLLGLSNLQWTFILLFVAMFPDLRANWRSLLSDPLIPAAVIFIALQWLVVIYAPAFHTNALKAAARFSVGFVLLIIAKRFNVTASAAVVRTWAVVAAIAGVYALAEYAGFGFPQLFRTEEFYIGQMRRLSGSFDYPNTAAVYFAMSLPIIWWSGFRTLFRCVFAFALWCAVILTLSRGALVATPAIALAFQRKQALTLVSIGGAAYLILIPLNPYLFERAYGPAVRNPISIQYDAPWNRLQQLPNTKDTLPIQIHNTGISTLRSQGRLRSAVAYRWWNPQTEHFIDDSPLITPLPRDVHRGETVEVDVAFETPDAPGKYFLVAELFSRNFDWFSRMNIVPILVEADIRPDVSRKVDETDLSAMYKRGQSVATLSASVPRNLLWKAALKMFIAYPFGVGADNYRLQYGKFLGVSRWDTKVRSNNLYLEILTGSGILGLAAFCVVIVFRRWRRDPFSMSAAVFLTHGLVDVFLMTTPIYFAFWILMGLEPAYSPPREEGWLRH